MTERRLQQAADTLPQPKGDYPAVEETFKQRQTQAPIYRKKRRRVALILCISLLLVGCVAGPTVPEYHLYNGSLFASYSIDSVQQAAKNLGWTIPETLGESPMLEASKYNLTTKESSYLLAQLFYHYTYYSVDYGYEMESEITLENGIHSTAHWTDADVRITFGSMDNEVWHRQFGFDENDVWGESNVLSEPDETYSLEYNGFTLYVGTYQYDNDFYGLTSYHGQYVHWIDYDHNTVFALYSRDDTPDFAIACAQEFIDKMH